MVSILSNRKSFNFFFFQLTKVDGEYCLTCGSDKTIKLWNPRKQLLLKTYSGHGFEVMDVDCSCDSSQLISGSHDKTLILWDVTTGQPLRRLRAHIAVVNVVRFNEDSTVFVSGSLDGMVKIWDGKSNSREPIQVLDEAKDSISYLSITDHEIATVSLDHHLRRYDIRKGIMEADNLHCEFLLSCLFFNVNTNDDYFIFLFHISTINICKFYKR